ncbi:hypothetical protein [Nannocystis radixulma]|uniref:Uncharacterized protein n=1 Tax=Nannocystis radixulma TaxID=2995305 RepID=A0ABT5BMW4_9BACT|nr:hypothetical protein [Nannocystis radixulma]MDC0675510.1 hypothetical protein [Nannocystis radixulma]
MIRLAFASVLASMPAPSTAPSHQKASESSSLPKAEKHTPVGTQQHGTPQQHGGMQPQGAGSTPVESMEDSVTAGNHLQVAEDHPPPGPPQFLSSRMYDGGFNSIDKGVLMNFTPSGGRYEVWEVQKNVAMDHALILSLGPNGAEDWRVKFQWAANESWWEPLGSTLDAAGNFYFMYITNKSGSSYKWRIVKVSKTGTIAWQKTLYTTTWGKEPTFMAAHPDGGVVVLSSCNGQVRDLYTARISGGGDLLWEKKYDVDGLNNFPNALAVAADGGIYVVGDDDMGMHVRKYGADGSHRWTSNFLRKNQYERPKGRHAFLAPNGDLVVAGSARGGNDPDWLFVNRYAAVGGNLLKSFVSPLAADEGHLGDGGLRGVYALRGGDSAIYFAWDDDDKLDSQWWLRRVTFPLGSGGAEPQVSWTRNFTGDKAMNVERLVWFPNGAIGVLGRGKRMIGNDYRSETRVRSVSMTGTDFGQAKYSSPGDFNNEPVASGIGREAILHVLGWQYWSGDGWNDENVMRLRFQLKYTPPPN